MVDEVDAGATVEAWLRVTLIHIVLTVNALEAWFTFTFISALIVHTSSPIATRVGLAFIDHIVTITACVSWLALTLMGISSIYATPSIPAHILHFQTISGSKILTGHVRNITVKSCPPHRAMAGPGGGRLRAGAAVVATDMTAQVNKIQAVESIESHRAGAAICAQTISAGSSILTRLRVTLIMLIFTESAIKTRATATGEGIDVIYTSPIVQTGSVSAFQDVMFTQNSIKSRTALAHKAVHIVSACGPILARLGCAFVHLCLTAISLKSQTAITRIPPHYVHTRATIQAWVRGAVIYVSLTGVSAVAGLAFT